MKAELLRIEDCRTPACGFQEPGVEPGHNSPAEVWRIGRLELLICQRCGSHKAIQKEK